MQEPDTTRAILESLPNTEPKIASNDPLELVLAHYPEVAFYAMRHDISSILTPYFSLADLNNLFLKANNPSAYTSESDKASLLAMRAVAAENKRLMDDADTTNLEGSVIEMADDSYPKMIAALESAPQKVLAGGLITQILKIDEIDLSEVSKFLQIHAQMAKIMAAYETQDPARLADIDKYYASLAQIKLTVGSYLKNALRDSSVKMSESVRSMEINGQTLAYLDNIIRNAMKHSGTKNPDISLNYDSARDTWLVENDIVAGATIPSNLFDPERHFAVLKMNASGIKDEKTGVAVEGRYKMGMFIAKSFADRADRKINFSTVDRGNKRFARFELSPRGSMQTTP